MELTKTCNTCGKTKAITEFNKSSTSKGGYRHTCRACLSIQRKREKIERQRRSFAYGRSIFEQYGDGIQVPITKEILSFCADFLSIGDTIEEFDVSKKVDASENSYNIQSIYSTITGMYKHGFTTSSRRFYTYSELMRGDSVKPVNDFRKDALSLSC